MRDESGHHHRHGGGRISRWSAHGISLVTHIPPTMGRRAADGVRILGRHPVNTLACERSLRGPVPLESFELVLTVCPLVIYHPCTTTYSSSVPHVSSSAQSHDIFRRRERGRGVDMMILLPLSTPTVDLVFRRVAVTCRPEDLCPAPPSSPSSPIGPGRLPTTQLLRRSRDMLGCHHPLVPHD